MWRWLAALLTVAVVLAGCEPVQVAQDAGDAVTLTFLISGDPTDEAAYQQVIDAFEAAHPEIGIVLLNIPSNGDFRTRLTADFAAGTPPDLFLINYRRYGPYVSKDAIEYLDPYIAQSTQINLDDYYAEALAAFRWAGKLACMPQNLSSPVIYYNKDIFDEVGVPYPDDTWTWDDFLAAADQVTLVEANGRVARYALGMEGGKYSQWITQNNGMILDDMRNPSECRLDSPESIAAVEFFAGMMDNNYAMRPANLSQAGGDAAVFQSGQVAMIIQNASRISAFNAAEMNYDVAVLPLPEGGKRTNSAAGAAWVMSKDADLRRVRQYAGRADDPGAHGSARCRRALNWQSRRSFSIPKPNRPNGQAFLDAIPNMRHLPICPPGATSRASSTPKSRTPSPAQRQWTEAIDAAMRQRGIYD
ncbi:MAG: sugar ABC transporter substrate-binding protein [Caldilineaceae bacterium]